MNTKVIAIAAVAILLVAGVAVFALGGDEGEKDNGGDSETDTATSTIKAISRVNTDGSGIYLAAKYNPADFYTKQADGSIKFTKEMGGKIWGTPGLGTIQHVQMKSIADDLGMDFKKATPANAKNPDPNVMYYQDSVFNYDSAIKAASSEVPLDGGILWETQYSMIADNKQYYQQFLLTNDIFPGHSCCVVVGYTPYMDAHPEETVAFMTAYIKGVNYILDALEKKETDPDCVEYKTLMDVCKKYVRGLTDKQIMQALDNVVYKYSDDNKTADLTNLIRDVAQYEKDLSETGGPITKDITKLGFKDSTEFAETIIDNSVLEKVLNGEGKKLDKKVKISVAAIGGDIHQIGLQLAYELGYFEEMNIDIAIKPLNNGGLVAQDILNGHSQFAFLGAPPMIINIANGGYAHA